MGDFIGERLNHLTIVDEVDKHQRFDGLKEWMCLCDCGEYVVLPYWKFINGVVKACGHCTYGFEDADEIPLRLSERAMRRGSKSYDGMRVEYGRPYENLAGAIVAVAADDYKNAVKSGDKDLEKSTEAFFLSDWYSVLTKVDPLYLMTRIRKQIFEEQERPSPVRRAIVRNNKDTEVEVV